MKKNRLYMRSSLHNLSMHENNNADIQDWQKAYYRGLFVMATSMLVDEGEEFQNAIRIVKANLPDDCISPEKFLPDSWLEDFSKA